MIKEELAALLTGREYGKEISESEEACAKTAGLIVIFGASYDLMELRGAIHDEMGAYDGGTAMIDRKGLLPDRESIEDDAVLEDFFIRRKTAKTVEALWCKDHEHTWTFKTDIPHSTFQIMDGEEKYCRGIVIDTEQLS